MIKRLVVSITASEQCQDFIDRDGNTMNNVGLELEGYIIDQGCSGELTSLSFSLSVSVCVSVCLSFLSRALSF